MDPAFLRRMPLRFHVKLPVKKWNFLKNPEFFLLQEVEDRLSILNVMLRKEKAAPNVDLRQIAQETEGMSGSDIYEVCRLSAVCRARYLLNELRQEGTVAE